jgi:Chaperone of endosialidase
LEALSIKHFKTNNTMKVNKLYIAAFATLSIAFSANAQVKIGSNPTTITANTNLEVEATGGAKLTVTKDRASVNTADDVNIGANSIGATNNAVATFITEKVGSSPFPFQARILREPGMNGNLNFIQSGTARMQFLVNSNGNGAFGSSFTWAGIIDKDGKWSISGSDNPKTNMDVQGTAYIRGGGFGTANSQGTYLTWNDALSSFPGAQGMTGIVNHRGTGPGGFAFTQTNDNATFQKSFIVDGGGNLSNSGERLSLHYYGTGNRNAYVDFHTDGASANNTFRIIRWSGANGDVHVTNTGTGATAFNQQGNYTFSPLGAVVPGDEKVHVYGTIGTQGGTFPNSANHFAMGWNIINGGFGEVDLVNYRGTGTSATAFRFHAFNGVGTPSNATVIATIGAAGTYTAVSDARVKSNIKGISYGLKEIMALNPVSYNRHLDTKFVDGKVSYTDKGVATIGFLAQEVYNVIPEVVVKPTDDKNGLWSIGHSDMLPVMVKAMQEQQAQIEAQKSEINELKAAVKALLEKK